MNKFKGLLKWRHLYDGILMGSALLAPGLSVGTIALVAGFYEALVNAIDNLFSPRWKEALKVLIPIGIGGVMALIISSSLISFALTYHPRPTKFLFLGLVIGAIPLLLKTSEAKNTFKTKHLILLISVSVVIAALNWVNISEGNISEELTAGVMIRIILSGTLTGAAMLLPGLSASLMLLILGSYEVLTQALSAFNLPIILLFGIGFVVGLVLSSKGIKYLLQKYADLTNAASIGMIFGSIVVIYPGITMNMIELIVCFITFIIGFFGVTLLNRKQEELPEEMEERVEKPKQMVM